MPVFVDHDERRRQVIGVASRLIAEAGLEALKVRDVAEAAECSTAIVSHYFRNKRELLLLTYNSSIDAAQARWDRLLERDGDDLRAYLAELLPMDENRVIEWKIWLAFWARAVADPEIKETQRACVARTRKEILDVLKTLDRKGFLIANLDLGMEARRLLTSVMGMAIQVMFDARDWSAERQLQMLDAELRRLYRPGRAPAAISGEEALLARARG